MKFMRALLIGTLPLCLMICCPSPAPAAVGTNPGSGNPADYSGAGDWIGTADPDQLTNQAGAIVYGGIVGNLNSAAGSQGGGNTINNYGEADYIYGSGNDGAGSSGGGNSINNYDYVDMEIIGSLNLDTGSNGGGNFINNSGAAPYLLGTYNLGDDATGGGNVIYNSGLAALLYSSMNQGNNSSGGGNHIYNSGVVFGEVAGSYNLGEFSTGGDNIIYNSGEVMYIFGSLNEGDNSGGGGNYINNSGAAYGEIDGSYNLGEFSTGGDNVIYNSGEVMYIAGSYNEGDNSGGGGNYINNSGAAYREIAGSVNQGVGSQGGGNYVRNSGEVDYLSGSINLGDNSTGGENTVINTGTVHSDIYGTDNYGTGSSGGGNTIINTGTVLGTIYGSTGSSGGQGNTIVNAGDVGGDIISGDAGDTVVIAGGSSVAGVVDGGAGNDTLGFSDMGTIYAVDYLNNSGYLNFEDIGIYGGRTILAGDWDLGAGLFSVESGGVGILAHGSVLTTPTVLVNSGGILGGNGLIISDVTNYGIVAPGASVGTLTINGNFINQGGTLLVELGPGSSDLLRVNGMATINGGYLRTSLSPAVYLGNESWTVLIADQVAGSFDGLISQLNSATLTLRMSTSDTSVGLVLSRKPYADFATNPFQDTVAGTLDTILPLAHARGGDMADLIIALDFGYSAAEITRALKTLSPEIYPAFAWAQLESAGLAADAVNARLNEARRGADKGQAASQDTPAPNQGVKVWARALGAKSNRDASQGWPEHEQTWGGLVSGADIALNPALRLGLALGYTLGDMSWDESSYFGDMKSLHLLGYGAAGWQGFYAQASLGLSLHEADARRDLDLTGYHLKAQGEPSAYSALAGLQGGYDFSLGGWRMGPAAGLRYIHLEQDGFSESGAGDLGLVVAGTDADSLVSSLGLNAATRWDWNGTMLRPSLGLAWQHEFNDDPLGVTTHFPGYENVPMIFDGQERPADRVALDAGLSISLAERLEGSLEFSQTLASGYSLSAFSLSLQYSF